MKSTKKEKVKADKNFYCQVHANYRPLSGRCETQCDNCKRAEKLNAKTKLAASGK